ncbi:glutaminyl-peptide cyclotransferase [Micromonospora sp. NBC_01813]|uniref:glutaminyl-peptide cyclotransferase n=1 Tax=Micromonospora sp. NBC_01813 TaxID=2975988 RepID=UPI002DD7A9CD|nr:glutaminyl-peptide cyclotransferase [Micromonospora sp. NBC_01813]WSA07988.1 glutaminyl-peptide cyclotransferase [Micromonospora sp. NBC_01813]
MRSRRMIPLVAVAALLVAGCSRTVEPSPMPLIPDQAAPVERLRVEVLERYPHDSAAFTQGLELHDGALYEGTGQYGESELRIVDLASGEVRQRVSLPDTDFGEGITVLDSRVWQITWREGVAYERDPDTLAEVRQVRYDGEGWGVCHDEGADRLVMSDGTNRLSFRDPESFTETGAAAVMLDGIPLTEINELECVGGEVWANVWQTDRIVRIDPGSGQVTAEVDASGLLSAEERAGADVLNGIAAVPGTDEFLITGKYWPTLFRVRFVTGS